MLNYILHTILLKLFTRMRFMQHQNYTALLAKEASP